MSAPEEGARRMARARTSDGMSLVRLHEKGCDQMEGSRGNDKQPPTAVGRIPASAHSRIDRVINRGCSATGAVSMNLMWYIPAPEGGDPGGGAC